MPIPFKQVIIKYFDEIENVAQKIIVINPIKNDKGYLISRNKDVEDGSKILLDAGYNIFRKRVLLLGAGGTARALSFIIANNVDENIIGNRTVKRAKELTNELKKDFGTSIEPKRYKSNALKEEMRKVDT